MDYFSFSSSSISKSSACDKMMISRANLYYQPKLPAKDLLLKQQIEAVLSEHRSYGHRRIAIALGVNKKRVKRVMKLFDIKARKLRKKPRIKKDKFLSNSARNLLVDFTITWPDQAWVSDFTYLSYQSRWLYLSTILDAFTREVIAWNISARHNTELITEALMAALDKRDKAPQIFHSDRGSEYRSNHVIDILKLNKIKASMSNKSSPWQNGKQESFYQKFKFELDDLNNYQSQGELIEAIALQIYYYNHKRIHSTLKMPPTVFYQRFKAAESSENSAAALHIPLQGDMQNKELINLI